MCFCTRRTSLFYFTTFHKKKTYLLVFSLVIVCYCVSTRKDLIKKYIILGCIIHIFMLLPSVITFPLIIFISLVDLDNPWMSFGNNKHCYILSINS